MLFLILVINLATYGSAVTQGEDGINTKVGGEVPRQTDFVDLQERIDQLEEQMNGRLVEEEDNRMWMDTVIHKRLQTMDETIQEKYDEAKNERAKLGLDIKKIENQLKENINPLWRAFNAVNKKTAAAQKSIRELDDIRRQIREKLCVMGEFKVDTEKRGFTYTTIQFKEAEPFGKLVTFETLPTVMASIAGIKPGPDGANFEAQTRVVNFDTTSAKFSTTYSSNFAIQSDSYIKVSWIACQ